MKRFSTMISKNPLNTMNENFEEKLNQIKKNSFLPMNFKLLLEFLNSKGKMRESEQTIKEMNDLMNKFNKVDNILQKSTSSNKKRTVIFENNLTSSGNHSENNEDLDEGFFDTFPHEKVNLEVALKNFQRMVGLARISLDDKYESSKIKPEQKILSKSSSVIKIEKNDLKSKKQLLNAVKSRMSFIERVSLDKIIKSNGNNYEKVIENYTTTGKFFLHMINGNSNSSNNNNFMFSNRKSSGIILDNKLNFDSCVSKKPDKLRQTQQKRFSFSMENYKLPNLKKF
jgi:hypothetical protein